MVQTLLVRAGALGDLLLLRRAIHALRESGYGVGLLAPPSGGALVGPDEVDTLLPWDAPETARLFAGEMTDGPLGEALRAADVVIAFTRSGGLTSAIMPHARRLLVRDPTPPPVGPHASLWLAGGLVALGLEPTGPPPDLAFTDDERCASDTLAARLPPRFVALHMGSGSPAKNWPTERFSALARRVSPARPWLLVLGPAESEPTDVPDAVVARGLSHRVLGALLSRAGLYVGNDSGVSHLAAAAGAPTLALFGPTDPAVWSPVGGAVRCLKASGPGPPAFTVDDVAEAAAAMSLASDEGRREPERDG